MALKQQPLRFEIAQETFRDDAIEWGDKETEDRWIAGDESGADEPGLSWDTSEDEEYQSMPTDDVRPALASRPVPRRGLVGMLVLTAAVFIGLTWAANRLPGASTDRPSGRDALLLAQPVASQPREILRLAESTAGADAAAHVLARSNGVAAAAVGDGAGAEEVDEVAPEELDRPARPAVRNSAEDVADIGEDPADHAPVASAVAKVVAVKAAQAPVAKAQARPTVVDANSPVSRPARVQVASMQMPKLPQRAERVSAKPSAASVYTVQVGAFRARVNAQDLISKLGPRLRTARIINEGGFYRVVSGSFESKGAAVAHEGSLRRAGLTTYVRTAIF